SGRQYHCPQCARVMRRINGKKGPFWGCSGFPACKTTLFDLDGKPSTEPDERYRCPVCTRSMIKSTNAKGDYWFCTGYNRGCSVTLPDIDGKPAQAWRCRKCGQLLKKRTGKNGVFWGCSQYPDCLQTYRDREGSPDYQST
ncbi:MAG: topoisomerase DNA-binding C4 zinc finger domain-containing protein, partial [Pseudomonadales bacterium]|nr:topoisomerase DNA-binding C4 zinc finger domain-containing protein [Pseudomonadales bacterium]